MRVAVLGAGGTIAPAIVRDLAASCIDPDLMFAELESRGVRFEITEQDPATEETPA